MLELNEAKTMLKPHEARFRTAFVNAWLRYQRDLVPKLPPMPRPQTRANILCDLIVDEVKKAFDGVPGTRIEERAQRTVLELDYLLIRFKKLDRFRRTRNYPTKLSIDFDLQRHLPGIPDTVRLTVGYQLNSLGTEMVSISVVFAEGKNVIWFWDLNDSMAIVPQVPQALPFDEERLARPKGARLADEKKPL